MVNGILNKLITTVGRIFELIERSKKESRHTVAEKIIYFRAPEILNNQVCQYKNYFWDLALPVTDINKNSFWDLALPVTDIREQVRTQVFLQ